ncbi:hypothetical protein QE152_g33866 [Popillia japonica]|uniref:Uncharacterized protein n=1 Tax=Popillia japonica TaxID=7064 RepID=A0AAW1IV94_POPJA
MEISRVDYPLRILSGKRDRQGKATDAGSDEQEAEELRNKSELQWKANQAMEQVADWMECHKLELAPQPKGNSLFSEE